MIKGAASHSPQRVEKVINLEKYVSLHAEQDPRNRAEFRI